MKEMDEKMEYMEGVWTEVKDGYRRITQQAHDDQMDILWRQIKLIQNCLPRYEDGRSIYNDDVIQERLLPFVEQFAEQRVE